MREKRPVPELASLQAELQRVKAHEHTRKALISAIYILIVVAAAAVLLATTCLPVLRIYGSSMAPTLGEKEIVVALKGADFASGDVVAFYVGNKILVKRCVATPGQWVDIDENGNVLIDGVALDEPYLTAKARGECNINLPYQVPEGRYFCLGDNRATSLDSRHSSIGCIAEEQVLGRVVCRVWPLNKLGGI